MSAPPSGRRPLLLLPFLVPIWGGCEPSGPDGETGRQNHAVIAPAGQNTAEAQSAAQQYRQTLATDPGQAGTHLALAKVLEKLGDLAASADHCDKALELDPANAEAWHLRGRLFEHVADDNAAVIAYETALEHAPEATLPRERLAGVLMRMGRYDSARRHYAERLGPGDQAPAPLLYRYGLALVASGRCAAAANPLQRAYAADPTNAATAEALIRVRSTCAATDARDATGTLSLAAELFRARPDAAVAEALAMAHAASGDFDNAVLLQRRVVTSGHNSAFSLGLLAHFERGEPAPGPFGPDARVFAAPRPGGL